MGFPDSVVEKLVDAFSNDYELIEALEIDDRKLIGEYVHRALSRPLSRDQLIAIQVWLTYCESVWGSIK